MNDLKSYIVVQAGGRGSRLRHHTWNKPKCLVSVRGKPLLYHLFDFFPNCKFIVIGDYAFDQLENYLQLNPPSNQCQLIKSDTKGTLSGIAQAMSLVPANSSVLLIWSDLIIDQLPDISHQTSPVVFTTSSFTCRWSVSENNKLQEVTSSQRGVPGIFYFPKVEDFINIPKSGEFVRWFAESAFDFNTINCPRLEELGDFESVEKDNERSGFSRFFNQVEILEDKVIKKVIDHIYDDVHQKEIAWYEQAKSLGFTRMPRIFSYAPLEMERIRGFHAYQMKDLTEREKRAILADSLDALIELHETSSIGSDLEQLHSVYIRKTIDRVHSVSKLIPHFARESVTINGKKCLNPFSEKHRYLFEEISNSLVTPLFRPIHGDPTFSNSIVDDKLRVWFIDPRGYFLESGIMGDPWYDFAKIYYSAKGNYDVFNRKKFKLHIDDDAIEILMDESQFSQCVDDIFNEYFGSELKRIKLIHGLLWLSLSGYAKDDIDSVIGSFYLGLYWLREGLDDDVTKY